MADAVNSTTKQRHERIFEVYEQVIAEYGESARDRSKKSLYEKVAQLTGYSTDRVAHIITRSFRTCRSK